MTQSRTLSQTQSAPTLMTQLRAPRHCPRPHLHALRQWGTFPSSDQTRESSHLITWQPSSLCPAQRSSASPAPRQPRGRRSGFFSPANTMTAGATRETSPAEITPQRLASILIVLAGSQHPHTLSAYPPTERMTMPRLKVILISLATLVALALATALGVKLLSGTNSEEVEVVEPGTDLHKGPELFDFSNMKVAGSSTLTHPQIPGHSQFLLQTQNHLQALQEPGTVRPLTPRSTFPRTCCSLQPGHWPGAAP